MKTLRNILGIALMVYGYAVWGAMLLCLAISIAAPGSRLHNLVLQMDENAVFWMLASILFVIVLAQSITRVAAGFITATFCIASVFAGMACVTTNYVSWPYNWVMNMVVVDDGYSGLGVIVVIVTAMLLVAAGVILRREQGDSVSPAVLEAR